MKSPANQDWLYHFTDSRNLESVQSLGLLSKRVMDQLGIEYIRSGSAQSIESDKKSGVRDYVSLSLTSDHPMLSAALREGRIANAKVIKINPAVISFDQLVFCPKMANSKDAKFFTLDDAVEQGMIDFQALFGDSSKVNAEKVDYLSKCEVLVPNCVPACLLH